MSLAVTSSSSSASAIVVISSLGLSVGNVARNHIHTVTYLVSRTSTPPSSRMTTSVVVTVV